MKLKTDPSLKFVRGEVKSSKGFYVGDLCYVLDKELYYKSWKDKFDFQVGVYELDDATGFGVADTDSGDGAYEDQLGHVYGVDAGVLSVVSLELVKNIDDAKRCGAVFEIPGTAVFFAEDGKFVITLPDKTDILIDTVWE